MEVFFSEPTSVAGVGGRSQSHGRPDRWPESLAGVGFTGVKFPGVGLTRVGGHIYKGYIRDI